jgi:hypothetical protein
MKARGIMPIKTKADEEYLLGDCIEALDTESSPTNIASAKYTTVYPVL